MSLTALGWWLGIWTCMVAPADETPSLYTAIPPGEALLSERGCLSCHAATPEVESRLHPNPAPHLDQVGARLSPTYMRRYLTDPHATRPGTRMPDLLAGLTDSERSERIEDLVHFLVSRGGPLANPTTAVTGDALAAGRRLYHEVGCIACHQPVEPAAALEHVMGTLSAAQLAEMSEEDEGLFEVEPIPGAWVPTDVRLDDLAYRTTVPALARFLANPNAVRPGARMPSLDLTDREAEQIAVYLLRDRAERTRTPGIGFEYFEAPFDTPVGSFEDLSPVRRGSMTQIDRLPDHRPDHFGFRFSATMAILEAGSYRFFVTSDDGSRLWIDDELVVANDGFHPMQERSGQIDLGAGAYRFVVESFERDGGEGLRVDWEGPGRERSPVGGESFTHEGLGFRLPEEEVSLSPDAARVERGQQHFVELGCASCHPGVVDAPAASAPALGRLDPRRGCLAAAPAATLPQYALDAVERTALREAIGQVAGWQQTAPTAEERVVRTLARHQCLACHRRDDLGSPRDDRRSYFVIRGDAELGDEGRIPPHLDHVGNKLRPSSLESVLLESSRVRPYMAARMPQYGAEHVGELITDLIAVDARPEDAIEPPFTAESVQQGRQLVGTDDGLGCINCHTLGPYESLGVPAVDLATMTERLRPGWFRQLLLDPMSVNMITRMPKFWLEDRSPVDIAEGAPGPQIDAMWSYLSLGDAMPLPKGLVVPEAEFELAVLDEPVLCGVFMAGVSPRTLVVGNPESLHYAFDLQGSRLAKAWRGRFFNAKGTWHARAGALESPPTDDVLELAPGAPFALLPNDEAAWPDPESDTGYRTLGRRFDDRRRPSFRYRFEGMTIEEKPVPRRERRNTWLQRSFQIESENDQQNLWFRAAVGRSIQAIAPGVWLVDDRSLVEVPVGAEATEQSRRRTRGEWQEILVPVRFVESESGWTAAFEVELTW